MTHAHTEEAIEIDLLREKRKVLGIGLTVTSYPAQEQAMIWLEGKGHIVAAVIAVLTGAAFLLWMMT
jgi:hypothetical protein